MVGEDFNQGITETNYEQRRPNLHRDAASPCLRVGPRGDLEINLAIVLHHPLV